ncbi:phage terminase large subunit family protein [Terricaulis silvestris]|uniref:Bacteriophage tail assembly protein n=1 Tax=Terricaulis silvestris TaxID=2686094 RepID=A0A6I6MT67_9CAUL|nr:terminase gpA endonuclease subunit [Terricaulis silvestris]QGZ94882.1 Bacteriophage tail assembly protein [Terricaulis silvestris]
MTTATREARVLHERASAVSSGDGGVLVARKQAKAVLAPPPRLSLADWMEAEMRLPAGVSAEPGRVQLWAYQREIADAISDPACERVTLCKSVRVGLSTLLTGAIGAHVANDPANIMLLLPTESDCRDYVVSDLEPIFEATPVLRGLVSGDADETGRSTLLSRRFPGGSLKIVPARAPRNLRRHNVRILLMDECDAYEITNEGSPIDLAIRRTLSYPDRKIIMGSTPTNYETGHVLRAYEQSDQRIYESVCPECGGLTEIQWRHIEWPKGEPEKAAFRCPHCEALIPERFKAQMVSNGAWRATRPEVKGHAGFRINALVSTLANASWAKLAAEFRDAKRHPDKLRVFVNTILAEEFKEDLGEGLDEGELATRAESFSLESIPAEVLWITCGVDVQRDRLECSYLGHTRDGDILVLKHEEFWGSPQADDVWQELDDALKTTWKHPLGGTLRVDACAVDAGDGETTDSVIGFTKFRAARRVYAVKGVAGQRPMIEASKTQGSKLFIIGVDSAKSQLLARLSKGRSVRFSHSLGPEYYSQLTSERRVVKYLRGSPVARWERISGRRAEALDSFVYGWAVRQLIKMSPDTRENELRNLAMAPVMKTVHRSKWMQGER